MKQGQDLFIIINNENLKKGMLKKEIDYDLKKLRLAISDKPVTLNPRELSSPQSSNL